MTTELFVDTNILLYAHDADAGAKQQRAAEILKDLWRERTGAISTQVLQEFYVNVTRKIASPLPSSTAKDIIERYAAWTPVETSHRLVCDAIEIEQQHRLSFGDAMIVAAAQRSAAHTLLTEDLNHGQRIGSITIQNPFEAL